ncbi:MBL fold metallo-hydrolase [Dinoroseobacter sp. PD6]|uniref:MBL fold metallo-hydrolase n=1 Tax=Dinoroseobacter sp. PD6 TaxID=3028384 RepID=UPI00237BC904|nr:MBL fold metallo-hydrolase [Dinoroseobacter sp. PD6]MDD9715241.1 MBL fold metallo-hydrolase [Dinoroseobacter sp. PD6]
MNLPPRPPRIATLAPGLRRVIAENPSPMTYWGTNSFVLGTGRVAVIDPGPAGGDQVDTILGLLDPGEVVSHVFVTHAHLDHSPGARELAARSGAPVLAFGDASAGRSPVMAALAEGGALEGGEGVDRAFEPDIRLAHGDRVDGGDWTLEALWTPGHFGNHLSFACPEQDALFCGDLVMGWSTSLVSPPDGDLSAFMASLDLLARRREATFHAGHGAPIVDPRARIAELVAHRQMRSTQIRAALGEAPGTAAALAARIYTEIPRPLLPAAARNVLAHLIDMASRNEADHEGPLTSQTVFRAV